ncbi:hypothetical protein AB4059_03720 [Lysobacter sp. 2RAF19]
MPSGNPWTIRSRVRSDIAEWRRSNDALRTLRPSALERELIFYSERVGRLVLSLLLWTTATTWAIYIWFPRIEKWWPGGFESPQSFFTTLWSVQATLAALVYPIVIAFISLFLQRRPASQAILQFYVVDTGALVAGISSLTLVFSMGIQSFLLPQINDRGTAALMSVDWIWFVSNSLFTTYFLYRTIVFLRPEVQQRIIERYTSNVALPRDVAKVYAEHVLLNSSQKGWIGKSSDEPNAPKISFLSFDLKTDAQATEFQLRRTKTLVDVRLWLLKFVTTSWMHGARKYVAPTPQSRTIGGHRGPELILPLEVGRTYARGRTVYAVTKRGPQLAKWQAILIRHAYVFRRPSSHFLRLTVDNILTELRDDTQNAVLSANSESFDRAYDLLADVHGALLASSTFTSETGEVESCALLAETGLFAHPFHKEWVHAYRPIFKSSVDEILKNDHAFGRFCYLASRLRNPGIDASPLAIRDYILTSPTTLMFELSKWWINRIEQQGASDRGPHRMVLLAPPLRRVYTEQIVTFVGGWEAARHSFRDISKESAAPQNTLLDFAQLSASHVSETARMLLAAVFRGDREAAEWFADVLQKWWGVLRYENVPFALYGKTAFLNLDDLPLYLSNTEEHVGISPDDLQLEQTTVRSLHRAVTLGALQNYWEDVRLVVLEILTTWTLETSPLLTNASLSLHIAKGMARGLPWRGGGTQSANQISANSFLAAKIRQHSSHSNGQYEARIGRFFERARDLQQDVMVSGRTYTSFGSAGSETSRPAQAVLLSLFSGDRWQVSEEISRQMDLWTTQSPINLERTKSLVRDWLAEIESPSKAYEETLTALLESGEASPSAADATNHSRQSLRDFLKNLDQVQVEAIQSSPIDENRLIAISHDASSKAFSAQTAKFPIALFGSVEESVSSLSPHTFTMRQVRRGELTRTIFEPLAVNESQFWADTMSNLVGTLVLSDVLGQSQIREISAADPQSYWNALKREASLITSEGQQPILILDNATRPEWVWQWQYPTDDEDSFPRPSDLNVRRDERGDGYVCDFNNVHVYSAPLAAGRSIVLSKSIFQKVLFREFADDRLVEATVRLRSDSPLLVDLDLTIERSVMTDGSHVCYLVYEPGSGPGASKG